jgi:epoxyqueuosine reductase
MKLEKAVPALVRALRGDPSPLVRGHAAWALGEIGDAKETLMEASETEKDAWCLQEIGLALVGGTTNATLG